MATDPPEAPAEDLVARVHHQSRAVIDAELHRLSRRAPSLRPEQLAAIDAALDQLVESLLLARMRGRPEHTARLRCLFDTPQRGS
jgi:hypothetical protein